ncbi:MAG: oligoribonuclease [Gammaproteobacteria bacterium HGW-Gammaproteobacteria-8]|nr:MAG: oligoribonuclease [Gammaproteobacteria bacterium HGW-Gammaproteobacteria-8]
MGKHTIMDETRLIWIDLEMTGLDTRRDSIIEIATIVTTAELDEVAIGPNIAIRATDDELSTMDEWNTRTHSASGLIQRCLQSATDLRAAERETLEFLGHHVAPGKSPMCGNSICQDRRFLARQMPDLEAFFHYRNLDVSTVKELARRWAPEIAEAHEKDTGHQALADIRESIEELRYYRRFMGRLGGKGAESTA